MNMNGQVHSMASLPEKKSWKLAADDDYTKSDLTLIFLAQSNSQYNMYENTHYATNFKHKNKTTIKATV